MSAYLGRAASPEEAEALERALAPVLEQGALEVLLEYAQLLRLLRARGAHVVAAWEALVLESVLALVSGSARARAALRGGPCGLAV